MQAAFFICAPFCQKKMKMGVEVYPCTERLDNRNNSRIKLYPCDCSDIFQKSFNTTAAEITLKFPLIKTAENKIRNISIKNH
jgi:hypothetical protein